MELLTATDDAQFGACLCAPAGCRLGELRPVPHADDFNETGLQLDCSDCGPRCALDRRCLSGRGPRDLLQEEERPFIRPPHGNVSQSVKRVPRDSNRGWIDLVHRWLCVQLQWHTPAGKVLPYNADADEYLGLG